MSRWVRTMAWIQLALAWAMVAKPAVAQDSTVHIAGVEEIAQDFESIPCDNPQRLPAVRTLYERGGATPSDIRIDTYRDYGGVENLVVVKRGNSPETIVIGAHYDKTGDGCGAVDNWSGQVAVTNLYRTLRNLQTSKTLVFVAFGREENGLVGSRAMAQAIPRESFPQFCGMINIDSLGLSRPQVADNMSSRGLERLAAEVAKEMGIPFSHASLPRAYSDSNSFIAKKIPAITIHGLDNNWTQVLHHREDQASKVDPTSVYLGYRLALAMVARLDQAPCNAYR